MPPKVSKFAVKLPANRVVAQPLQTELTTVPDHIEPEAAVKSREPIVRHSVSMPKSESVQFARIEARTMMMGIKASKSELVRAALLYFGTFDDDRLENALAELGCEKLEL